MRSRPSNPADVRGLLALLVALCAGCAHYGWANRASTPSERPVAVETVDVAAHHGVDSAALTQQLTSELRERGLSGATWRAPATDAVAVRCAVRYDDVVGFGTAYRVRATAECSVYDGARTQEVSRAATSQTNVGEESVTRPTRRLRQLAATEAIEAVAHPVAVALSEASER